MLQLDVNGLSAPDHGYTVDDDDDDDDDDTAAKEEMFRKTDTEVAPWVVVKSNDKKRARVNAMRHLLAKFDYDGKDHEVIGEPDPLIVGRVNLSD